MTCNWKPTSRVRQLAALLTLMAMSPAQGASDNDVIIPGGESYGAMPVAPVSARAVHPPHDFTQLLASLDSGQKQNRLIPQGGIVMLGQVVPPGSSRRLTWAPQDTFESIAAPTPVLVLNGANPGPTLCLTGAVHGDELNGIEMIRRVYFELDAAKLSGVVVGVPIVNQMGFRRSSRYLPDRRDLNRYFPGHPEGSSASRIAYSFFNAVVKHCDALVDIHTGSFHRTNIPQLRADMTNDEVSQLAHGFGGMVVLHSRGGQGTLRRAATDAGIPAVTVEAGEPMRIQEDVVEDGVKRLRTLITNMGMYRRPLLWSSSTPVYQQSSWVRTEEGGLLISRIEVGDRVRSGDLLGKVVNPITNIEYQIKSPFDGQVIGMALNQVVMPGYAAYHIGMETTKESLEQTAAEEEAREKDGTTDIMDTEPSDPEHEEEED